MFYLFIKIINMLPIHPSVCLYERHH